MEGFWARIRERWFPQVPSQIRDEFDLMAAGRLQEHGRLLFALLAFTAPTAFVANAEGAPALIRYGAPIAMAFFCILGVHSLGPNLQITGNVRRCRKLMRNSTYSSSLIAIMCSAWGVMSWLGAPPESRIYYPWLVALGAFSTAYCLASVRRAAIANLVINLVPICVLLISAGNRMDLAAAVSLIVAGLFQLRMIASHHEDVVKLLLLRKHSDALAHTDPLTGLLNRRALIDHAVHMAPDEPLRLILVDIDNFKAVNDRFGHDVGDQVILEVAGLLAMRAAIMGSVARIGGEEFAIIGPAADLPDGVALGMLQDVRTAAMPHGEKVTISIGVGEACVRDEHDWRDLFHRTDAALYEAKRNGRNRISVAEPPKPKPLPEMAAA